MNILEALTEEQREQLRGQQAHQMRKWVEQRVWDLCDDISNSNGYNQFDKLSDSEVMQYARGAMHNLEAIRERFECSELRIRTLIDGALGERYHRTQSGAGKFKRRLFGNLAGEIRAHRVAMLDQYVTFDYAQWTVWRKRVLAIERKGYEREEWEEFQQLQNELNALYSLSSWLVGCQSWRENNWEWRKSQEVKVAA